MSDVTPRHPIRVVARRTGLTPATLRAWERRYGVVEPGRSDGGQRLYSDLDIERLGRLRALTDLGRPIGLVAGLPDEEAQALLAEDRAAEVPTPAPSPVGGDMPGIVERAYGAVARMDGRYLDGLLRRSAVSMGATRFLDEVAEPLLRRVGAGWVAGEISPAHEHMGSGIVEQVLGWLAGTATNGADAPYVVITTLPGERHGLGARLVAATATTEGWNVLYLGTDLPVDNIASAAEEVGADVVSISVVLSDRIEESIAALRELRAALPDHVSLLVGGRGSQSLPDHRLPAGVLRAADLEGFRAALRERAASAG